MSSLETLLTSELDWKDFNDEWSLKCTSARVVDRELMVQLLATSPTESRRAEVVLCTVPEVADEAHRQRVERALSVALVRCQTSWISHVSAGLTGAQVMAGDAQPPAGDPFEPFERLRAPISRTLAEAR